MSDDKRQLNIEVQREHGRDDEPIRIRREFGPVKDYDEAHGELRPRVRRLESMVESHDEQLVELREEFREARRDWHAVRASVEATQWFRHYYLIAIRLRRLLSWIRELFPRKDAGGSD